MSDLRKAAQALVDRWDSPLWKDAPHTGEFIDALRAALAQPESEPEPVAWLPSAEWTACIKLPMVVHVRSQRPGEAHVSTREGITPVKPDDLIMRGVSGEEYPIGREIFERTYRLGDAPPQRKPLTYEQISNAANSVRWSDKYHIDFARAIERAHGIS